MAQALISNLDRDGEVREFIANGRAIIASAGAAALCKGTFEPGWRYSTDVDPLVGSASCQTRHLSYVLTGTLRVQMDDGTEYDLSAGDLFDLPAGHDAWVIGDDAVVIVDTSPEATSYAKGGTPTAVSEDRYAALVRRGYDAFNNRDIETLVSLMAKDVVQHVPGTTALAGDHKGIESVLSYYGALGELTNGTFRADLIDAHADGHGHVIAVHQTSGTRNGVTRVSRGSILFTFLGDKMTDLLEMHADLAGDDAFLS
jgi:ketosteroid isomerase-like protein